MREVEPAIPAATLVLYLESAAGPARLLMITRSAGMAFAAGALVFPGGRVDSDDHAVAMDADRVRDAPRDAGDAAARVAAIRESIEETGIAVGVEPAPDSELISRWRASLKAHTPFGALLREAGVRLDLSRLAPLARWSPSLSLHRRFDTRFYAARFTGDNTVKTDATEASHHLWVTAEEAIEGARAGRHLIIFPTLRNLERLAAHPHFDDLLTHLAIYPVKLIIPEVQVRDGIKWLCIPEGAGYPVTSVPLSEISIAAP